MATDTPTLWLVGPIASGKSAHAAKLTALTLWPVLAIDDYRRSHGSDAWTILIEDLKQAQGPVIVESVMLPEAAIEVAAHRRALICSVTCPEPVRKKRIARRGWRYEPPAAWADAGALADATLPGAGSVDRGRYQDLIDQAEDTSAPRAIEAHRAPKHSRSW